MRDLPKRPNPHYGRAIFLDRDGTINVDTHYPYQVNLLEFLPHALEGLLIMATLPFEIIVVSNQAGIALGLFTTEQMSEFNTVLKKQVERAGGRIDAFYYCPHFEPKDLPIGVLPCACSKPAPGLLLEAANDFELNLSASYMIGDKTSDIVAGQSVGCTTILVKTGKAGLEEDAVPVEPALTVDHLLQAAQIIQAYRVAQSFQVHR
jgi:D-glycero-D-manno-heptose 1,7-bisphosphate phosphatase